MAQCNITFFCESKYKLLYLTSVLDGPLLSSGLLLACFDEMNYTEGTFKTTDNKVR